MALHDIRLDHMA